MSSRAIPPGATLGVLGGGQLGRMFVHAAQRMGYFTAVLDRQFWPGLHHTLVFTVGATGVPVVIGVARALVTRPGLLLVDEPTAALDRQRSQEIVGLLAQQAHEHGVATLMVTHDHDVLHHCDRVYEMVDGRLGPA